MERSNRMLYLQKQKCLIDEFYRTCLYVCCHRNPSNTHINRISSTKIHHASCVSERNNTPYLVVHEGLQTTHTGVLNLAQHGVFALIALQGTQTHDIEKSLETFLLSKVLHPTVKPN